MYTCAFVDSSDIAVMAKTMLTDCDYEVSWLCLCSLLTPYLMLLILFVLLTVFKFLILFSAKLLITFSLQILAGSS